MRLQIVGFFIFVFCCGSVLGQELANGSFEGPRGASLLPPGWEACGRGSTPDTQPGAWHVLTAPAYGESYISLICRGEGVPYARQWERCQQRLQKPLTAGQCYVYQIDLARSPHFSSGRYFFTQEVNLRIWGGDGSCQAKELLWESGPVAHVDWQTYEMVVRPAQDCSHLVLEAYYIGDIPYSGNILVDNFSFVPEGNPCIPMVLEIKSEK
ncbi:MAG: hypothetical protein AAF135_23060 [Bacteroidota bacterium]